MGFGKFPGRGVARHSWTEALGGFGCIHGTDFTEPYPKHLHARLVVAIIEGGTFQLVTRAFTYHARPGDVVVINTFRVHGEWWNGASFRALYLSPENLSAASSAALGSRTEQWFEHPVLRDPELERRVRDAHDAVQGSAAASVVESRVATMLATLSSRWVANEVPPLPPPIAKARDLLHVEAHSAPTIDALSRLAGQSQFHFIRTFHREVGLPPHAYFDQLRIARAKEYLVRGHILSDTAYKLGYCDQSHFTRSFRRSALVTPGQYLNMVRSTAST
jgi:AraC-like DNA-binding protein